MWVNPLNQTWQDMWADCGELFVSSSLNVPATCKACLGHESAYAGVRAASLKQAACQPGCFTRPQYTDDRANPS